MVKLCTSCIKYSMQISSGNSSMCQHKEHVLFLIWALFFLRMHPTNPWETDMIRYWSEACAQRKFRPPCRMMGCVLEAVLPEPKCDHQELRLRQAYFFWGGWLVGAWSLLLFFSLPAFPTLPHVSSIKGRSSSPLLPRACSRGTFVVLVIITIIIILQGFRFTM